MKRHHHFIFHLAVLVVGSLIAISAALLYYYDLEQYFLAQASSEITPKQYFYQKAEEEGLNVDLLNRIITCESHWRMVQNAKSSAFGYFQILDRTERSTPYYLQGKTKKDPYDNIDMGLYLFKRYGWQPWTESKPCWGPRL